MPSSYVLKIRQGCAGGGKGPLIGKEVSFTLSTGQDQTLFQPVLVDGKGYIVRRLTPVECERLQGFPDDWTKIPYDKVSKVKAKPTDEGAFIDKYDEETGEPVWKKNKVTHVPAEKCPDGPRYKALGNSMAVSVIRWLGERIEMVNELVKEIEDERKS